MRRCSTRPARSRPPIRQRAGSAFVRGSDDEVELLLVTFDRALAALRGTGGGAGAGGDAQDELSAVERALGPQLESGLLMFASDGRLLAANPAAVELLGGDPRAAREAAPATAAVALAAHPALAAVVAAAIADGRSIPRASVTIERGGRSVELGLTLQALRRGGAGFLVLLADVTDLSRREAEERFAAGLAQLGELSAGVAHELRNSLATVQGYLTLAARRDLPPAAREEIAEARREAEELARVVDDFLTFARPGSGTLEAVDLAALLARATSDPALAGVDVRFVPPETPLPPIAGDPHLLQRAVRNLLLNAVQATLAGAVHAGRDGAVPEEGEPGEPPEPPEPPSHPSSNRPPAARGRRSAPRRQRDDHHRRPRRRSRTRDRRPALPALRFGPPRRRRPRPRARAPHRGDARRYSAAGSQRAARCPGGNPAAFWQYCYLK